MKSPKIKTSLFFLCFIYLSCTHAQIKSGADFLDSLEPLQNAELIITPHQDHTELIQAFNLAKTSIYVGIFGITDLKIAEALSAAQKRGVKVIVICDKACSDNPKRLAIFEGLKSAGVEIYTASTGFSISHWKMFVIDDSKAFISTMNFIVRTEQMRDLGVFLTNPTIVQEIIRVFKSDVENAKNQTAITPTLNNSNLVWSPNNSEVKLTALIGSAQKSIEIWIENMGNAAIHQALKAAVQRGVKVRLLTSECGMGMPAAASFVNLKDLAEGKIDVHVMPFPASSMVPYIHAKSISIDRKTQFLGSENFSYNSLQKARELGIIFQDKTIEARLNSEFESDWRSSISLPAQPPETCSPLTVAI